MTKKKIAIAIAAAALAGTCAIGGTLAWLTDTADVTNTFTIGNVGLTLTETPATASSIIDDEAGRTDENQTYTLTPGSTAYKDPRVTITANSEDCYVFVAVKNTLSKTGKFTLENSKLNNAYTGTGGQWVAVEATGLEEGYTLYLYHESADDKIVNKSAGAQSLEKLFTGVVVDGSVVSADLGEGDTIDIKSFAIQSANVDEEEAISQAVASINDMIK